MVFVELFQTSSNCLLPGALCPCRDGMDGISNRHLTHGPGNLSSAAWKWRFPRCRFGRTGRSDFSDLTLLNDIAGLWTAIGPLGGGSMSSWKNYIGGDWVDSTTGATLDVLCPSDGAVFASIADSTANDIDHAVAAAQASLSGDWGAIEPSRPWSSAIPSRRVDPRQSRRAGCHRGTRYRQTAQAGSGRYCGLRTIFRVLRRCSRQASRRDHSVSAKSISFPLSANRMA